MEQRNLIIAIALSVAIILGWQLLVGFPTTPPDEVQTSGETAPKTGEGSIPQPSAPGEAQPSVSAGSPDAVSAGRPRAEVLAESPRIAIDTPTLRGSINLKGGRIDDLILKDYRQELPEDSPKVVLLSPEGMTKAYYANVGWAGAGEDLPVPDRDSLWQADADTLTPDQPVTLTWDNGQGLIFERTISVDENYLFDVTQRVVNNRSEPVALAPYGLISRRTTPETLGFWILHEGLLGVFEGTLKEVDYDDLQDDGRITQDTTGGWLGITDKYWLTALIPDQEQAIGTRFVFDGSGKAPKYQSDYIWQAQTIGPGAAVEVNNRLFLGAKVVTLLDRYRDEFGIVNFDLAVDFGWFYFMTKPIFYVLHYFQGLLGNFGLAILALTVLIKLIFFPLSNKSYKSMAKMRKLGPEMQRLRERYGDDKQKLNQEVMQLYKKEKVNPLSGCLPILIQIPVFFALYKVLFVTIEMRHAPFYGWIQDLSAKDPTSVLNGFGLLPWDVPELGALNILNIGIWPLIMGATMFLQQRLNPPPPDKTQAMIFQWLPVMFTFILAGFPAGLVIYWTWNNTLSVLQQIVIMKRQGVAIGRKQQS